MQALTRQNIKVALNDNKRILTYTEDDFAAVIEEAKALREEGVIVEMKRI